MTEQIATALEEGLLESILCRARGKGRGPGLLLVGQAFSQPCHGAIDVMQIHGFDPRDGVALLPVQHARAIAAGDKQAMQDGQKENPLQRDSKASAGQQSLDDLRDLQLVPEPPEDQCRADAAVADGGHVAATMRGKHHHGFGELGSRLEQAVELAALLQLIEPTHGGDDALLATPFFPAILDDLEIDVRPGSFLAEEHGGLRAVLRIATMIISVSLAYCQYIITLCGTMHIAPKPFFFHQITTYDRKIPSAVEDGSRPPWPRCPP